MATGIYEERVNKLLKEKSTLLSIGLFTLFFIVSGILIATNQNRISVTEIDQANREAFLQQRENGGPAVYIVQEGEGLWQIAEKTTGNGENWVKIAAANNIQNPDTISAGQRITIPDITATTAPTQAPEAPTPTPVIQEQGQIDGGMTGRANPSQKEYIVQEGEGLWQIAEKVYGDGEAWTSIMRANNLSSPEAISPGMKLIMPNL